MWIKKPSNAVETEEENQLFQIDKTSKNLGQQKREKLKKKPILDSIANW